MKKIIYTLMLSVLLAACSEEADFSSDASLRLEFSCDTIMFDTLFTTIGSPTAMMKVYNRNSSSLRLSSVKLVDGKSGFRINVDGQFADVVRDIEIRKKDSMYLFVEATLDGNGANAPLVVSDSVQFTLESGVQQYVTLLAYGRDVDFLRGVTYNADAKITAGHYIVYDSIVVAPDVTLLIEPGVTLYFHKDAEMIVRGTVKAEGSRNQPVIFRGDRTDYMFSYLPYDNIPGQWGGITIDSLSNDNLFAHCDIHSAKYGIKVVEGDSVAQRLTVESSRIENFDGNALETAMARVDVRNSLLANARGNCVKVVGGSVRFVHCTIANFYVWKQRDVALALHNSIDGRPAPLREALFANCIVEGSREDEIMGYLSAFGDSIPDCRNYLFVSSLLNTVNDGDSCFVNNVFDDKEKTPFGAQQFKLVDHSVFMYDFHLSDSALARGVAAREYSSAIRYDLDGNERPDSLADAGCFQYIPVPEEEGK